MAQMLAERRAARLQEARLALKFEGEAKGMCCAAGKIKLPQLE
ncbi:unnamed protein product, partial [Onchocerca ochengi]|uniref:Transposase n=1 Tax=Onchocerca ochengi TaxID=42157 RepID=A0A182EXN6_ONCOC